MPTYNLLVGSDKSKSVNCKSLQKQWKNLKKKPMLVYILPHMTFVFLAEGLCNTPPLIWWSEAEANPAQVTFHHCCLHWPGFTRKQKKSEQFRRLCWSPWCSVLVLSPSERTYTAVILYLKTKHPCWCVNREQIDSRLGCLIDKPAFIYLASIK